MYTDRGLSTTKVIMPTKAEYKGGLNTVGSIEFDKEEYSPWEKLLTILLPTSA